jgi:acyl-CoA synthetase (AMP-forming)/AMP-acid ligase II
MPEKVCLERLEQYVINAPDRTAVIYNPDERLTFRELWELSGRIYAWLKARGAGSLILSALATILLNHTDLSAILMLMTAATGINLILGFVILRRSKEIKSIAST